MAKQLIARGQATVYTQNDAYNINQSLGEYIFSANNSGLITNTVSFTSNLKVTVGDKSITNFTIGTIAKPAGFSAITINNTNKTITYSVAANTSTLADNGNISIPVIINGETYYITFSWSKAKSGQNGNNGQDAYTVSLSRNSYVISTDKTGKIHTAVTITTVVSALKGSSSVSPAIGTLPAIPGCTLSKSGATITIVFAAGTTLAENGIIDIPVTVDGKAFSLSFTYAKARTGADGATGAAGVDANMLDWVKDWNTNKTVVGTNSVITPKIFAGVKNSNGTLTGMAIGKFPLSTLNASGQITTETINGIYGFKDGYKTFFVDSGGNAQLGKANQFIKYNAATGKIEFGSDVSLNWTTAANNALASAKSYADTKKAEAISAAATDTTTKTNEVKIIAQQANDLAGRKVRYIRDWLNGSTANTGNHWVQVMAYDKAGKNIALNKNVSGATTNKRMTNGDTSSATYASGGSGLQHAIVDLGAVHDIFYIQVWHYYADGRTYNDTKTECSVDGKTWFEVFNSSTEGKYKETANGIIHYVSEYDRTTRKSLRAQETADAITKRAADEKWDTKLTYIDANGIFTGTLSANTVNAVKINASQIIAGTIDVARINVAALKSSLITAANIEALTLNVVRGKIGGWSIDADSIFRGTKNNTTGAYTAASGAITIGSNGIRGFKWKLDSNGTGAIAGGNIAWDAAGKVTFGSGVSLNWTNAANTALSSAKSYADTKKAEAINAAATDATTKSEAAKELALAMAFGKMLYRDPIFYNGNNGINVYNNSNNGTVTITRTSDSNAPNDSKQVLVIKNTGTSSPNCGGFQWSTATSYRKVFITRIIAKIPTGRNISYHSNSIGTGGVQKWLTPVAGTGDWCEYICKISCGTANFSSTNYFAITGAVGTTAAPVEWRVAYATVFDNTSTEKYSTTIDANGIYTGTIKANQVMVDSALVVGGSTYNGSISVRDASNVVKVTLNRSGITAVGGTIGGWAIASNQISKNSVILGSDGTISNGTKWKLANDGSGYVANSNISWTATGAVTITGTINATSGIIGGFTISGNKLTNKAADSALIFNSLSGASYVSINESTYTLLAMRADSARTAISIQTYASGARGISIIANAGSTYAIESYGPHQFGQRSGERWNAPGVLFSALVKNSSTLYNRWGNGMTVTSFSKIETGGFMCYHNLGHTEYIVVANPYWDSVTNYHGNCFIRIEFITSSSFKLRVVNADNGKQVDTNFTFAVIGRNKW
ncbi:hypothetical protein [Dysgonomonas sp. 511]|uniref:hypothetical protein n=1 Tax=Dysgonomonas sp. 511 TaxID=2302930 RepID=UPI0013D33CCF|nr:hypothetical protein [Dysgonomonas sp. 511]NDV80050.1 hypothetical protein [Dysgonomonas sp. 511]